MSLFNGVSDKLLPSQYQNMAIDICRSREKQIKWILKDVSLYYGQVEVRIHTEATWICSLAWLLRSKFFRQITSTSQFLYLNFGVNDIFTINVNTEFLLGPPASSQILHIPLIHCLLQSSEGGLNLAAFHLSYSRLCLDCICLILLPVEQNRFSQK